MKNSKQLVVFDMDGVLIDVSASYRDVVRQTARTFLLPARSSEILPDPLFSLSELAAVKQRGGLNNDWDLTYLIVRLLFARAEKPKRYEDPHGWNGHSQTLNQCDVGGLAHFLKTEKSPLAVLLKKEKNSKDKFITAHSAGDVGSGNIIKQIFQEIYLGPELFERTYGMPPRIYAGKGYIHKETLLVDESIFAKLSVGHTLAIATGRPKGEADFAIDHHGIRKYFSSVYTLDDCLDEEKRILAKEGRRVSLSKPNPFMLDAIAAAVRQPYGRSYYIGDMPDDMIAAQRSRSGFKGVGFISTAPDKGILKRALLRAGAEYIVEDLNQIERITK